MTASMPVVPCLWWRQCQPWPWSSWQMEAYLVVLPTSSGFASLVSAHLLSLVLQLFEDTKYQRFAFSDSVSRYDSSYF